VKSCRFGTFADAITTMEERYPMNCGRIPDSLIDLARAVFSPTNRINNERPCIDL
jgi:hypothetical protein